MASSNRHWPSFFKSKPCTNQLWDMNPNHHPLSSSSCRSSPYSSGCEERSPEPKPRWNPKPEQIRILESIFNSGMVNPPRDEIRKIRAQLQEYGQVGDANVFYWFQNRKSRSKHKLRHPKTAPTITATTTQVAAPPCSSSSSSEKSSPKGIDQNALKMGPTNVADVSNSPTGSVNQNPYFGDQLMLQDPVNFFPLQQSGIGVMGGMNFSPGLGFVDQQMASGVHVSGDVAGPVVGAYSGLLMGEMGGGSKGVEEVGFLVASGQNPSSTTTAVAAPVSVPSLPLIQGVGDNADVRSTVFINDVAFDLPVGPINVKELFGDDAVLVLPTGHPVLTNEWGVTCQPLQHGACYYLVRTLAATPLLDKLDHHAPDLLSPEFPYQI